MNIVHRSLATLLALGSSVIGQDKAADPKPDSEVLLTRIALSGCHKQDHPAPALERYLTAKPQLMLWVGDNIYADTRDDINYIKSCYETLGAKPGFRKLRDETILMAGWDDHDFGFNNEGKNYALKEQSKQLFREFWRNGDLIPADRDGVYHARTFGSDDRAVQIIILDPRHNRDDEGPISDTLGEPQWAWLAEQLKQPAALRLLVSGYQILLDADSPWESWSKFPKARQRLFDLIRSTEAENLVFITGDQHYGEVLRMRDALGYDAVEFMFSGINQAEPHAKADHRVSPVSHAKHAYALIDIHWGDGGKGGRKKSPDKPHLLFTVFDAEKDVPELTYRVNFSELAFPQE